MGSGGCYAGGQGTARFGGFSTPVAAAARYRWPVCLGGREQGCGVGGKGLFWSRTSFETCIDRTSHPAVFWVLRQKRPLGYTLSVTSNSIAVAASTSNGAAYGLTTLAQVCTPTPQKPPKNPQKPPRVPDPVQLPHDAWCGVCVA